jgi:hypothetical protein
MKIKNVVTILGIVLIGIGAADLLLGNTDHTVLPDAIGDHLTQQSDLVLIGAGALAWYYA